MERVPSENKEAPEMIQGRFLAKIARDYTDALEDEEAWKALGLAEALSLEVPEHFNWSVYVGEHKGKKSVGVKIFDANGRMDMYEYPADDSSLPLSTGQDRIDQEIRARAQVVWERKEEEKRKVNEKYEKERGFPAGDYSVSVTFPDFHGKLQKLSLIKLRVQPKDSREDVSTRLGGDISMMGLHNFGLRTGETKAVLVQAVLKHENGTEMNFEKYVNGSGHIVTEKESKKEG